LPLAPSLKTISVCGTDENNPDAIFEERWHQDNSNCIQISSPLTRSSACSATPLDGVELIENTAVSDTLNVEPIVTNIDEKLPATIPPNSAIQITPIKLYGIVALFSAVFLVIGIGIGILIGFERFRAVSDVPALQTTSNPNETIMTSGTSPCSDAFKFSTMSNVFFVNTTRLQADCSIVDIAPFMDFLLAALRIESISGNLLALLGLCVIVQLGGIPSVTNGDKYSLPGLLLWLVWMSFSVLQYITTFIAQLMGVLAVFSFVGQYEDELVTFQGGLGAGLGAAIGAGIGVVIGGVIYFLEDGGLQMPVKVVVPCAFCSVSTVLGAFYGSFTDSTFFAAIVPSLIFHPTFVARNAALSVYAFIIFQGIAASKIYAFNIDKAMQLYAIVMVAPLLATGIFYFVFTVSVIFSIVFFVPMSLCLAGVFLVSWYVLTVAKKRSREYRRIALQSVECDLCDLNPLKLLDGSLWWIPSSLISTIVDRDVVAHSAMLLTVLFSLVLIVLSPLLVFGHWAAFYSYLGRHSSNSMAFVALTYEHFFGVLLDVDFSVPDLVNFNFEDISQSLSLFANIPRFDELPPATMLEGSAIFLALSSLLACIKPLVCLFSFILSIAGLVGTNKKVGKVAEVLGSYEGIFNGLIGLECISALQLKNDKWDCKLDDNSNIIEMRVPENTVLDIGVLANCKALRKFYATGIGISGKNIPATFSCAPRVSPPMLLP